MVTLIPIIGGLASGFVGGVLTVELRARREQRLREQRWYARTIRLAQRVTRANVDRFSIPQALYARNACSGILGNLSSHIMEAPSCVSDEMLDAAEDLAMRIQAIQRISQNEIMGDHEQIEALMGPTAAEARRVIEIAQEEKDAVGRI